MLNDVIGPQRTARMVALKGFGLGVLVVGLIGIVAFAVVRENVRPAEPKTEANASFVGGLSYHAHETTPLSPEEEAYATALWPIHSEVKLAAVRMIFAGLAYKTEDHDAKKLKAKVRPLTKTFEDAGVRVGKIKPPAALQAAHESYVEAVRLYSSATREMVKVADDGKDAHLIVAQQRSEQASLAILMLSDVLWPGEYKPN